MQRKNAQSLGDAIREFLRENRIDSKLNETRAIHSWHALMGKGISGYTQNIYIKNGVLYVHLTSAVLRQELQMSRERIIRMMNEHLGTEVITEIIFR
ncbi:MAG: DUF721 domain-containing protein [Bacteroidales bacterium]